MFKVTWNDVIPGFTWSSELLFETENDARRFAGLLYMAKRKEGRLRDIVVGRVSQ